MYTYAQLLNKTLEVLEDKGSMEAYQFISKYADQVKGNRAQIYNFQYCLAASSGQEHEALQLMEEAIIQNGFWYAYDYLMSDEDLKPLHPHKQFQKLTQLCQERENQAKAEQKPELKVLSHVDTQRPLIMAIHGDQENSSMTELHWQSVIQDGVTLALPQSSQIEFSNAYNWDNKDKGTREILEHYEFLISKNEISSNQVILGGFSAGCGVGLNAVLTESMPVTGLILVAPWFPDLKEWQHLLSKLKDQQTKVYVICGEQDVDCLEGTNQFVELLKLNGVNHTYKLISGLDHEYPEHFEDLLSEGVEFILNN
ncbi:alpha/beta hydrolase [Salinibacillus xinjiangensis]|uniref:Alpha/beta hydrolase n=1 Tax=Salinibacillus xinjiangensis TaxID=1229268 RepID=A0A6G1X4E2_9BACI|nr:alpha/beta hydrolase [Salinibacillus xinjiangensis]MRG85861.1 alpha/beta hydrolase [Salinibacillus xinjiangensis]